MKATGCDPRDIRWEVSGPRYRVTFWTAPAWDSQEWELADGDLREVMAWADEHAVGRTVTIGAVVPDQEHGLGLIQLLGTDPTAPR